MFVGLLEQSLKTASLSRTAKSSGTIPLESATAYAEVLRDGGSLQLGAAIDEWLSAEGPVVDSFGHRRPVYRPIWVYAVAQSFHVNGRPLPASLRSVAASLTPGATASIIWTAATGQRAGEAAWSALARFAVQPDREPLFDVMIAAQQRDGAWLHAGPADNIETRGYDELVLLHAITSYAVLADRTDLKPAIEANAAFHGRELQPDHATNQPWALHALASSPSTLPLAEQLLHAAAAHQPGGLQGLPVVLLADALYGLRATQFFSKSS